MAANLTKLAETGTLPALAAGETLTITPSLIDGKTGEFLPIAVAEAGLPSLDWTIDNSPVPGASATATVKNNGSQASASGVRYYLEAPHSIQAADTVVDRTAEAPVAGTAASAEGSAHFRKNGAVSVTPGGTAATLDLSGGALSTYKSAGDLVSFFGNTIILSAAANKSVRIRAVVRVSSDAAEDVTVQLLQDPGGTDTVLASNVTTIANVDDIHVVTLEADVAASPGGALSHVLQVNSAAGALTVGGATGGISVVVEIVE